jgi:hypothetical protein
MEILSFLVADVGERCMASRPGGGEKFQGLGAVGPNRAFAHKIAKFKQKAHSLFDLIR